MLKENIKETRKKNLMINEYCQQNTWCLYTCLINFPVDLWQLFVYHVDVNII